MKYEEIKRRLRKGFTLTEMMVVVAISLLIIGAVYSAYSLSRRGYLAGEEIAEITQNGRVILERMSREIRQTKEIVTELPSQEIIFEDGHTPIPSPYGQLGSDYYYIRYYIYTPESSGEPKQLRRQYMVYCFDDICQPQPNVCSAYFRWNDTKIVDDTRIFPHPCNLEESIVGEYITNLNFTGLRVINIFLTLAKKDKSFDLETKIFGRNL